MTIKEFIEDAFKHNTIHAFSLAAKLLELEAIEKWFNLMYGAQFEITVMPIERPEGKFYGKGLIEELEKETKP